MRDSITRIQSSIVGLILLLTSWLILNTINPQLVRLAPLPRDLWDVRLDAEVPIGTAKTELPPCDIVVVWPETNQGGNPIAPIRLDRNVPRLRLEGSAALERYSKPWASAKSFIRLTGDELTMLEDRPRAIQRYNDLGVRDPVYGMYKLGGICSIELFQRTDGMFEVYAPCGGSLGHVQLPESDDFRRGRQRFEEITCVEIVQGETMGD